MKIKLSELRRIIREELNEAEPDGDARSKRRTDGEYEDDYDDDDSDD